MNQLALFAGTVYRGDSIVPRHRANDAHTSVDAAKSMTAGSQAHRDAIMQALKRSGASTAAELADLLPGLDSVQVTRRLSELHKLGKIERRFLGYDERDREEYQTRPSPRGRAMCVWHLTGRA